jgi:hypothetical protein
MRVYMARIPRRTTVSANRNDDAVASLLENLPAPDLVRARIAENLRQRQLLRQVLRLSEQRELALAAAQEGDGDE